MIVTYSHSYIYTKPFVNFVMGMLTIPLITLKVASYIYDTQAV